MNEWDKKINAVALWLCRCEWPTGKKQVLLADHDWHVDEL